MLSVIGYCGIVDGKYHYQLNDGGILTNFSFDYLAGTPSGYICNEILKFIYKYYRKNHKCPWANIQVWLSQGLYNTETKITPFYFNHKDKMDWVLNKIKQEKNIYYDYYRQQVIGQPIYINVEQAVPAVPLNINYNNLIFNWANNNANNQ